MRSSVSLIVLLALAGCSQQKTVETPKLDESAVAISAVQAWKPNSGKVSLGQYSRIIDNLNANVGTSAKSIGWGAKPNGGTWVVTYSYTGAAGLPRAAKWSVKLSDPPTVKPLDQYAEECDRLAATVYRD